jgi:hypothetical protein
VLVIDETPLQHSPTPYLSVPIHADPSVFIIHHAVMYFELVTGYERVFKTVCSTIHAMVVHYFIFVFASSLEASHDQHILKIAVVSSSGTLFCTHHGTPSPLALDCMIY